jgi:hypothetical protein
MTAGAAGDPLGAASQARVSAPHRARTPEAADQRGAGSGQSGFTVLIAQQA